LRILRFLNLLAGLAILAVALGMWGAIVVPALDVITHFAYPLLIVAGACFVIALLLSRRWDSQRVLACVALIACLGLTGPEFVARLAPHSAPAGEPRLRLMTYNLFWQNKTPDKAEAVVRASGADVVILIESGNRLRFLRSRMTDLYPHQSYCPCGLTILSRWPIIDDYMRYNRWQIPTEMNWAVIESPAGRFTVMGVHMNWPTKPDAQAVDSANLVREAALFDRRSLIVMGDFNSTPWSRFIRRQDEHLQLERRTRALPTWPARLPWTEDRHAPFPLLPIDQVYAGTDWRTLAVRRGPSGGSDHYSVIVDLARRSAR
jgi:endonuclease/exonuclease/phosphatase (EEP) superfamily protein YafD